jgi:hypothetical protein
MTEGADIQEDMPALDNPRHERFARAFMKCGRASEAFRKAGYKSDKPRCVWTASSRLLRHVRVKARIGELKRQMASRNRITVDSLLDDLQADRALARELGQTAAAIQATQLSAKLVGLLVDRKETGNPGDFASLQTRDEVLQVLMTELGEDAARLLSAALSGALPGPIIDATRNPDDTLN